MRQLNLLCLGSQTHAPTRDTVAMHTRRAALAFRLMVTHVVAISPMEATELLLVIAVTVEQPISCAVQELAMLALAMSLKAVSPRSEHFANKERQGYGSTRLLSVFACPSFSFFFAWLWNLFSFF